MTRELAPAAFMVLLIACNKVKEPPQAQVNVIPAPQSSKSAAPALPEPNVDLESLPVEEDYEEEAEKLITPKTLLKKVDELEKEISAEP
jgi:hypothetical protein